MTDKKRKPVSYIACFTIVLVVVAAFFSFIDFSALHSSLVSSVVSAEASSKVFQATVMELDEDAGILLVEPFKNTEEFLKADLYEVPLDNMDVSFRPVQGELVEVFYDGTTEESYPVRLLRVDDIRICDEDCDEYNEEEDCSPSDTCPAFCIDGITYFDAGKGPLPVEIDESIIRYVEMPLDGPINETITAYAIVDEKKAYALIDNEWYEFVADHRDEQSKADAIFPTKEENDSKTENAFDVTMEVDEKTVCPTGATVRITNNTDLEIDSGNEHDFAIEEWKNDMWCAIEISERDNTDEAYVYMQGVRDLEIHWADIYGTLPAGKYRIIKSFFPWSEDGTYGVKDRFNLMDEFCIE